jgi:hypothetical protein
MVGSYLGSPLRKIVSAAVALKPVMSVGCSRLQLLQQFPKRAYLIQVALFKFRSDWSASSLVRLLAVLMSCILGSLLLLFFHFHSDSSLCIPSGNFRMMDLLVAFCGLGVPPPVFPPPPPPFSRMRSLRGPGVCCRVCFGVGTNSAGLDCEVLRLLLRIPLTRKSKSSDGSVPSSNWCSLVAVPNNCSAARVSWNSSSAPIVLPKYSMCSYA